ncbi:nucleotidyltransferase family protein [Microcoleus sp. ZQ-A2]|nr:nucleotidyltransferase family protein [Microcoleus sp. FACHB-1]
MQSSTALPRTVNTNIDNLRPEDQFILACLQHQQSLSELALDEELLIHRMKYHRVTSMVYQHLLQIDELHRLSAKTQAILKQHYQLNIGRNLAISYLVKRISKILAENNIETMTLKGATFIESFPDYALVREMSDLDIMVKSPKLHQAIEALSSLGFEYTGYFSSNRSKLKKWYYQFNSNAINLLSKKNKIPDILLEVHWRLFSTSNHTIWKEKYLWNRAKYCSEKSVYHLDATHALLHICAHQCNDLQIYLYGLVDVANILNHWGEKIDWNEAISRAKSQKLLLHLVNILRLSNELLNIPLPDVYYSYLQSYESKAQPGYQFILERLFHKELSDDWVEAMSETQVFRRLEYSNSWQRLWCELNFRFPKYIFLKLIHNIAKQLP